MAINKGNYYNPGYKGQLTATEIDNIVFQQEQGKLNSVKEFCNKAKFDQSVSLSNAKRQIKEILTKKDDGSLWQKAQEGKLEKASRDDLKKFDREIVKANLEKIDEMCSGSVSISKNKFLDQVKSICNKSKKSEWTDTTDSINIILKSTSVDHSTDGMKH